MNTFTKAVLLLFAFTIISCDKDYNTLGSDIVGDEHFDFEKWTVQNLSSYSMEACPVQTNNLPLNSLGIYDNPVFGTTKANFVSQIEMIYENPSIGYDYDITANDSVYIYIPFFSTLQSTTEGGEGIYELDSIYGDPTQKFNLKIYENGYYLSDFDPTTPNPNETAQKYFSDFNSTIFNNKGSLVLNAEGDSSENTEFFFNKNQIVLYERNGNGEFLNSSGQVTTNSSEYVVKERKLPGIWINLNKNTFKTKILDAVADGKLFNNNIFKQHFKGLYFNVEEINPKQGSLANLDFSQAELVVQYRSYSDNDSPHSTAMIKNSLTFRMGYSAAGVSKCNSINLFDFSNITPGYQNALLSTVPQETHYLKGGSKGSVVYIDAFNATELAELRAKKWLINEANLVFYVDQTTMSAAEYEPLRLYLYDVTNNRPLLDWYYDTTVGSNTKYNKYVHDGIIQKETSGKGIKYKIRITDHINNVLNGTNPNNNGNSRLGLVVTENINISTNLSFKNPLSIGADTVEFLPSASIMNPLGTVIYGAQSSDSDKKLKLEIYYTEPN